MGKKGWLREGRGTRRRAAWMKPSKASAVDSSESTSCRRSASRSRASPSRIWGRARSWRNRRNSARSACGASRSGAILRRKLAAMRACAPQPRRARARGARRDARQRGRAPSRPRHRLCRVTDTNECDERLSQEWRHACDDSSTCVNTDGGYECVCSQGSFASFLCVFLIIVSID